MKDINVICVASNPYQLTSIAIKSWRYFLPQSVITIITRRKYHKEYSGMPGTHVISIDDDYDWFNVWPKFRSLYKKIHKSKWFLFIQADMALAKRPPEPKEDVIEHYWKPARYNYRRVKVDRGWQPRIWEGGLVIPRTFIESFIKTNINIFLKLAYSHSLKRHGTFPLLGDTFDFLGIYNEQGPKLNHIISHHTFFMEEVFRSLQMCNGDFNINNLADVISVYLKRGFEIDLPLGCVIPIVSNFWSEKIMYELPWHQMKGDGREEFKLFYENCPYLSHYEKFKVQYIHAHLNRKTA